MKQNINRTMKFDIDYETYSECDIKLGSARYAEDPSTKILMFAISCDGRDPFIWDIYDSRGENSEALRMLRCAVEKKHLIYAHNYQFEHFISKYNLLDQCGIKAPSLKQWRCTASMARRAAIPFSLEACAEFLGLGDQKDKTGKQLIQTFSVPSKRKDIAGQRFEGNTDELVTIAGEKITAREAWSKFVDYCKQDVRTQIAIHEKLKAFDMDNVSNGNQLGSFLFDAELNDRGVPINRSALNRAQTLVDQFTSKTGAQFADLTGIVHTQRAKVLEWLQDGGYPADNLRAGTIEEVFDKSIDKMDEDAVKALRLYRLLSFAAIKKIPAMLNSANSDGRVRGTLMWSGALRTHRWSGKIIQPQNMRRPTIDDTDLAYEMIRDPEVTLEDIEMLWESPLEVIASCIRHFIHLEGRQFIDVDYSNIEARILPWLSGEEWVLDAYKSGKDMYKVYAEKIFGTPYDEVTKPERFVGKLCILGAGYQAGANTFSGVMTQFGYETPSEEVDAFMERNAEIIQKFNDGEKDERFNKSPLINLTNSTKKQRNPITRAVVSSFLQLKLASKVIKSFRKDNPNTVNLWHEFAEAAIRAVKNKGERFKAANGKVTFGVVDVGFEALIMRLPSGHSLVYPKPRVREETKKYKDASGEQKEFTSEVVQFQAKLGSSSKWGYESTYGGKLVENACQAIGGDFLSHGVIEAEAQGYETFAIIHDQALCVYEPSRNHSVQGFTDALCKLPNWASDFPLEGEGAIVNFYTKD